MSTIQRVAEAVKGIRDHLDREPRLSVRPSEGVITVNVQGWDSVDRPMGEVREALTSAGIAIIREEDCDVGDEDCPKSWGVVYVSLQ